MTTKHLARALPFFSLQYPLLLPRELDTFFICLSHSKFGAFSCHELCLECSLPLPSLTFQVSSCNSAELQRSHSHRGCLAVPLGRKSGYSSQFLTQYVTLCRINQCLTSHMMAVHLHWEEAWTNQPDLKSQFYHLMTLRNSFNLFEFISLYHKIGKRTTSIS